MRKAIIFTEHARFRLRLRRIPRKVIEEVLHHPMVEATDTLTGYSINVGKAVYGGRERLLAVTFDETE